MKSKTQKSKKKWLRILFIGLLLVALAIPVVSFARSCYVGFGWGYDITYHIKQKLFTKPMDILFDGSDFYFDGYPWRDKLPKQKQWKQIVKNSQFTLGEPRWEEVREDDWVNTELRLPDAAFPNLDGSTVMIPMAVEFARQHLGMTTEQAEQFYNFSKTHQAYEYLCGRVGLGYTFHDYYFEGVEFAYWDNGPTDLVLGTTPGEEEFVIANETGVTLVQKPVCRDAFVFITGKNNPVESLTLEQVQGIFSGEITNWKEVGGANEKIQAYQRQPGSGSQTGIEQLVMQGVPMATPKKVSVIVSMGELVDAVAEYQNSAASIGYSYRYYIDNQYSKENIKQLKIEGVAPTDENIRSGAYPLSVSYVGVFRQGEEDGPGAKFLDWILSEEGQACVEQAGYIKLAN